MPIAGARIEGLWSPSLSLNSPLRRPAISWKNPAKILHGIFLFWSGIIWPYGKILVSRGLIYQWSLNRSHFFGGDQPWCKSMIIFRDDFPWIWIIVHCLLNGVISWPSPANAEHQVDISYLVHHWVVYIIPLQLAALHLCSSSEFSYP